MQTQSLHAIDRSGTIIREDGFDIRHNRGTTSLTIASVIPPVLSEINIQHFLENLKNPRAAQSFLPKPSRKSAALHEHELRDVLCVTYRLSGETLTDTLHIDQAVVGNETFEGFMVRADFPDMKHDIEKFLTLHNQSHFKKEESPQDPITDAQILVSRMLSLFNETCSVFAWQRKIKTLKRKQDGSFDFGTHSYSHFSSPLRKAVSFINMANLYAFLAWEKPPFTRSSLKELGIIT